MADPVSDMLIRVKNSQRARHETVIIPFSKFKLAIAKLLEKNGYIGEVSKKGKKIKRYLEIKLLYKNKTPMINEIRRVSKSGQRIYVPKDKIKTIKQGYGISIISTSRGLMTNKEAKKEGLGGEMIAEIW